MANSVIYADNFFTRPAKTGPEGAQFSYASKTLATTELVSTQIVAMAALPAKHRLMSAAIESSDLDTNDAATLTGSLGILNSNYGEALDGAPALESGQNILTDSTVFRAGGRATPVLAFSNAIGVDNSNDRIIALHFTADSATPKSGTVGLVIGTQPD